MDKELLDLLKTIPKERYEEILKNADTDFDIQKFVELIKAEGVELTQEQAQQLEEELKKTTPENGAELSDDQLGNISGGLSINEIRALWRAFWKDKGC